MPVEVIMPKVDMDMATGKISKWHVKEGDAVAKGMALFEIETDKASMEIEAEAAGIIRGLVAGTGADIPVGSAVAFIYAAGEGADAPPVKRGAETPPTLQAMPEPVKPTAIPAVAAKDSPLRATPLAKRLAKEKGISLRSITGSGPHGRIVAADVENQKPAPVIELLATVTVTVSCDVTELLDLRDRLNLRAPKNRENERAWQLTSSDFIIKSIGLALRDQMIEGRDIGLQEGSSAVSIRSADTSSLSAIAITRAKASAASQSDGGTLLVISPDVDGVEQFTPGLNTNYVSALGIGSVIERFVRIGDEQKFRPYLTCTLTSALPAATATQLLSRFKAYVEEPALMLA